MTADFDVMKAINPGRRPGTPFRIEPSASLDTSFALPRTTILGGLQQPSGRGAATGRLEPRSPGQPSPTPSVPATAPLAKAEDHAAGHRAPDDEADDDRRPDTRPVGSRPVGSRPAIRQDGHPEGDQARCHRRPDDGPDDAPDTGIAFRLPYGRLPCHPEEISRTRLMRLKVACQSPRTLHPRPGPATKEHIANREQTMHSDPMPPRSI